MTEIGERRPIAAREWRWSGAAAAWLARRGVSANAISLFGMAAGIAGGVALATTGLASLPAARLLWLLAAACIQTRLLSNMLDGMVAQASGTASALGELYNEVPDRISDTAVLVGFGYAAGGSPVLGMAAALAAVATAYVRSVGKGAGVAQQFCGPMAKQQRMAVVTVVALVGAVADPGQTMLTGRLGASLVIVAELLILVGGVVTVVRRLRRIVAAL